MLQFLILSTLFRPKPDKLFSRWNIHCQLFIRKQLCINKYDLRNFD